MVSLPYHNPLWVADRALFLDRLLRGRFMLGLGPGALPTDATMIGISLEEQRTAFEDDVDVLMAILRGEKVTAKTSRYNLVDAQTQFAPYSDFDIVVAAIASPTGPRAAAKNGINLLSVGATAKGGFDALALHWDVMEQRGPEFGHTPDRGKWRLCGPMHLAETKEQAIEDVRFGLDAWCDYTQDVLAAPHFRAAGKTFEERVAWVNETGLGVIGTPDEAVAQIERLEKQSGGLRVLPAHRTTSGPVPPRRCGATSCSPTTSSRSSRAAPAGWSRPGTTPGPDGPSSTSARATPSRPPRSATPRNAPPPAESGTCARPSAKDRSGCHAFPKLLIGAQSEPGIDRAARLGDGVITLSNEHFRWYTEALERHGRGLGTGRIYASQWVIVAEDPERVWAEVGERALHQMNEYIAWGSFEGPGQPSQFPDAQALLDAGVYRLMDASPAVEELAALATEHPQVRDFHYWAQLPGEPVESGSARIQYLADHVIPQVNARLKNRLAPV